MRPRREVSPTRPGRQIQLHEQRRSDQAPLGQLIDRPSARKAGLADQGALEASAEQLYSEVSASLLEPHALVVLGQGDQVHVEVLGVAPMMGSGPTLATASFSADTPIVTPVLVGALPQRVCPISPAQPLNFTALSTTTAPGQTRFVAAACVWGGRL